MVAIVIGAFRPITKELLKGLEEMEVGGRVETIQTTAVLRTARILTRVLGTWEDLLSLSLLRKIIIIIIIISLFVSFSHHRQLVVFHWSLSDNKSPYNFRTLLSILANLYTAVVSILPLISNSSSLFSTSLGSVPFAPSISDIIVTLISCSFFSSVAKS